MPPSPPYNSRQTRRVHNSEYLGAFKYLSEWGITIPSVNNFEKQPGKVRYSVFNTVFRGYATIIQWVTFIFPAHHCPLFKQSTTASNYTLVYRIIFLFPSTIFGQSILLFLLCYHDPYRLWGRDSPNEVKIAHRRLPPPPPTLSSGVRKFACIMQSRCEHK